MYFVTYKTIYLPKSGTGPNNFWRLVSYYSQMKFHVRVLLFENPSELLSLGIVGNGVHEEDVSVDVHVAGQIVPDMGGDGLLGDPRPWPGHHRRVDQVIRTRVKKYKFSGRLMSS